MRIPGAQWGVTDDEAARHYPCDDVVPSAPVQVWRGVTVAAPAAVVWAWLRQVQLAPYSYDLVDNLGRRSPRQLQELPEPRVGGRLSRVGGVVDIGRVLSVVPGEQLTAAVIGAVMSYVVVPQAGGTRLLLKVVMPRRTWWAMALAAGDWPMARRQLLNLRRLAERSASAGEVADS
jgi:hypothetical protein